MKYGLLFWPSGLRYCGLGPVLCFRLHIISLYLKMSLFLLSQEKKSPYFSFLLLQMIPFYFIMMSKRPFFLFIFCAIIFVDQLPPTSISSNDATENSIADVIRL